MILKLNTNIQTDAEAGTTHWKVYFCISTKLKTTGLKQGFTLPSDLSHSMYYAAIVCPERINEKVVQYKKWMKNRFGCTVALKSPAHITLLAPFWLENEKENELTGTLKSFNTLTGRFDIQLEGFGHFGKRVLFIAVKESPRLNQLKAEAEIHFQSSFAGIIKPDERPFQPHVTIANRDMQPSHFEKAWEHFSKTDYSETFSAGSVSLLKLVEAKWEVIGEKTL